MAKRPAKMVLHGAKEMEAALRDLPNRIGKAAVRRGMVKALEPIAKDASARLGAISPRLAKGVSARPTLSKRQRRGSSKSAKGLIEAYVGAHAARWGLLHLIEFGTGPRAQKKTTPAKKGGRGGSAAGRSTGRMAARPFLRPAWEAGKQALLDELGDVLWAEIDKAAQRLAKKSLKAGK